MPELHEPIRTTCFCPNTPHEHDEFVLAAELPMSAGLAASQAMASANGEDLLATMIPAMLRHGAIESWNLVDENGKSLPVTPQNVAQRLTWGKGYEFLNEALPRLVAAVSAGPFDSTTSPKTNGTSSNGGRTAKPTSRVKSSSNERPAPSA